MMRVLEIVPGFMIEGKSGGVARFVTQMVQFIDRNHVTPIVGGLWSYGQAKEEIHQKHLLDKGIDCFVMAKWSNSISYLNIYASFYGLCDFLSKNKVDIIHSHSEFSDALAILAGRLFKIPIVMRTLHNTEWRRRPLLRPVARLIYPLAFDLEIGISSHVANELDSRFFAKLASKKSLTIKNAIDVDFFDKTTIDKKSKLLSIGIPQDATVIGSVGRLSEQKGYVFLIHGFAKVVKKIPNCYLVLVGEGELSHELQKEVEKLGIANHVVFTGPRNDVHEILKCLDVFVSSSLWEGLPTVVLESMASGIPVVATDIPGNREIINHGENGYLVKPSDPESIAQSVMFLLSHRELMTVVTVNGKQTSLNFSIQKVAQNHTDLYLRLASLYK